MAREMAATECELAEQRMLREMVTNIVIIVLLRCASVALLFSCENNPEEQAAFKMMENMLKLENKSIFKMGLFVMSLLEWHFALDVLAILNEHYSLAQSAWALKFRRAHGQALLRGHLLSFKAFIESLRTLNYILVIETVVQSTRAISG